MQGPTGLPGPIGMQGDVGVDGPKGRSGPPVSDLLLQKVSTKRSCILDLLK